MCDHNAVTPFVTVVSLEIKHCKMGIFDHLMDVYIFPSQKKLYTSLSCQLSVFRGIFPRNVAFHVSSTGFFGGPFLSLPNIESSTCCDSAFLRKDASQEYLDGGFKYVLFSSLFVEMIQFDFIEIAYHAWYSGWFFPEIDADPASYSSFLKKVINQAHKIKPLALCPGSINPSCKSFGKTLPTGFIEKSTFVMHPRAIKQLAIDACHRSHTLKSWSCPFTP